MYPSNLAKENPNRAAFIMAETGEKVSYKEYEARCNQLAHLLIDEGLEFQDHYSIFMENNIRYLECCGAGERSGLYYTCINSYLKENELAYIINNSESKILITSAEKLPIAEEAIKICPNIQKCLVIGTHGSEKRILNFEEAVKAFPTTPIREELLGNSMLYSSGTTGRPKGILRPLDKQAPDKPFALFNFLKELWQYREDMIYLSQHHFIIQHHK